MEPIVSNTIVFMRVYIYIYMALTNIGRWERGTNDQAQPCPAKSLFIVSTKSLIKVQNERDIVMFSIPGCFFYMTIQSFSSENLYND